MSKFKNPHFCPYEIKRRIESRIKKYRDAIQDQKIKDTIDQMPQTQETLDILESEFDKIIEDVEGNNEKEKWKTVMKGTRQAQSLIHNSKKSQENSNLDEK